ncbi:MAG: type II secretion system major pseudopilin GspG [Verrucomicrobia bacterium]|nr:type II secretion system major pseudopilin GspG [Verrucomicrobiota bacterium]
MKQPNAPSSLHRTLRLQGGFTLLEIMLVVVIISLLLGAAIYNMGGNVESARKVRVQADISSIKTQLKLYNGLNGFYPTTQQGLKALVTQPTSDPRPRHWNQSFEQVPLDPWGKEYQYLVPGKHNPNSFDLFSSGPDLQAGTADDLGNWEAEEPKN